MKRRRFCIALGLISAFVLWTVALCCVDVQAVGVYGSKLGLAELNRSFHELTGVHLALYTLTDWLSLIPVCFMLGFALVGLAQWIRRKSLLKVERGILLLGGFYVLVLTVYLFFEIFVINYRPVLIDGVMEASYPSSTTVLVLCVMPTAVMQLGAYIKSKTLKKCVYILIVAFSAFMLVCRLASGVHWFSDVVGGVLLSAGLVMLYSAFSIV